MDIDFLDKPTPREPHPAQLDDAALLAQCDFERARRGGPGGQHRNKTETAVLLSHRPTGLTAQASERREAEVNKRVALRRLRLTLATAHRCPVPPGDPRSDLWRSRTGGGRIVCSQEHRDHPALLGEALDVIAASGWDQHMAATRLSVTATQLIRFVGTHPPALAAWNAERAHRGMGALRA